MKRFNKNIITFTMILVIVVMGLWASPVPEVLKAGLEETKEHMKETGFFDGFGFFTWKIETAFSEGLNYHKDFLNLNSAVQNNLGTVQIDKGDTTVIKSKSGYLGYLREEIPKRNLKKRARRTARLYKAAKENGAEFMYIMAPVKGYYMEFPENVDDYNKQNCDAFIKALDDAEVPYFNLISEMKKDGITEEEMFFVTDHHWKPEYALWAANRVAEEMNKRFGFEYDKEKLDIENYNVEVHFDAFLGSQGKKTGQYFTELGLDDISIITPKFETSFTDTQVGKDYTMTGPFKDVLLHKFHIDEIDLYNKNPYATYLGGDYREQIIENHNNPDGKNILLIKDSFSCAFVPFFAMTSHNIHLLDMRDFDEFKGDRINVAKYIEQMKPDYVLVMYTGVTAEDKVYSFR